MKKKFKKAFLIDLGIFLTLLPFIIFDLRHPPGIFILGASKQAENIKELNIFSNLFNYTFETLKYYVQKIILVVPLSLGILVLLFDDIRQKNKALLFFLPVIGQIILVSMVAPYAFHYFLPIIPFFFVWLVYPREKIGRILSSAMMLILIAGSAFSLIPFLKNSPVQPDLTTVKKIDAILKNQIKENDLKNVNLAVLSREVHDYDIADNLFVISTASEAALRKDVAFEIDNFRSGILRGKWQVDNTPWVVYLLTRNEK